MDKYDCLKLENQLCFPFYVVSKEIIRLYKPFLDEIGLTYTQYITMMVLWDVREINVKELGDRLYLDSGTLTPLLKKLEQKNLITRSRAKDDERNLIVSITDDGMQMRDRALEIPSKLASCVALDKDKAQELYIILHELLNSFSQN